MAATIDPYRRTDTANARFERSFDSARARTELGAGRPSAGSLDWLARPSSDAGAPLDVAASSLPRYGSARDFAHRVLDHLGS